MNNIYIYTHIYIYHIIIEVMVSHILHDKQVILVISWPLLSSWRKRWRVACQGLNWQRSHVRLPRVQSTESLGACLVSWETWGFEGSSQHSKFTVYVVRVFSVRICWPRSNRWVPVGACSPLAAHCAAKVVYREGRVSMGFDKKRVRAWLLGLSETGHGSFYWNAAWQCNGCHERSWRASGSLLILLLGWSKQ